LLDRRLGRKGIPGVHSSVGVSKGRAGFPKQERVGAEAALG
jgi:hypothetical protein